MSRRIAVGLVACLALSLSSEVALRADVRSDQRVKFQLAGALGRVVNFFGGRAAKEGVTSSVAVKGSRKATMTEQTGQIVDLSEEKIYDLDLKKKTYRVTTFAEQRRKLEEARKKAEEDARKAQAQAEEKRDPNAREYEVEFDVKNTGEKKTVNGFDTQQSILTITVHEKGKTLEQSGGMVLTNDMWMTSSLPALKEVQDFDVEYAKKLFGPMVAGASAQDMAAAMAMYPMMKPAIEKMAAEGSKLQGTPIMTVMTFDAVRSAEQVAAEAKTGSSADSGSSGGSAPTGIGGIVGGFGRRMARRNNDQAEDAPKARATVMTTTSEVLKVATTVSPEEVAVPAGFKEEKR
ncbi:MAG: hypothetical protein AB7Q29_04590 [Vicinamibacterales bacterium]